MAKVILDIASTERFGTFFTYVSESTGNTSISIHEL